MLSQKLFHVKKICFTTTLVGSLVIVVGSCSLDADSSLSVIPREEVPSAIYETTTTQIFNKKIDIEVFVVNESIYDDYTFACATEIQIGESYEKQIESTILALVRYQSSEEKESCSSATTFIPPNLSVNKLYVEVGRQGNTVFADFNSEAIVGVAENIQRKMVGQIVFTATGVFGVTDIVFYADGEPISVSTEFGYTKIGQRVGRKDFPRWNKTLQQLNRYVGSTKDD